ncbi:bifunctional hydroxymethylpyrimidine kinase/phosphomethylpyrimidine kinase [Methanocaldococcus jannaschii]|uniref:Bifunctional thiamine biosynthesis protein ThiDN n=1 Tax=Methanocaldococcus jannaschii (strain ATCC 43067 / DSM 2661 / JAL-1 / JCM 10045 / NBRC 100440) TaxID=243232 RepID=THIDN_METJA|nr:thiamine-phosphate synthase family protein [Methanocaldococcus jannaschii]Q57688.2 RecName: Full=Bifunctional thiamine biosynthesis protein ThiDN; Includes: RecName: Full=Hydroxymethylpyrimidine/phosphomethylpyrimidine kinase; AltName: Full=Hydroxymethylpyrimidine kinase; Short=HMP kinase; AltName: Full=Hydroxymethylpyrimidine phosphate kinase; Short=HMP-P kinase; Short=HMP-phosphate kinase; Short=HMPP kinase; Includes: RecName: Full=Thiamine-phosphate synthase ThiN; Short=TP synthase; Short=TP
MVILAIGGYDPTSGAGISADIKTAHTLGVYCPTITTSVIPQNNKMVYEKFDLPEENIKNQFKAVFEEFDIEYVKTGVLTKPAIDTLLKYIDKYDLKVICDPVLASTTKFSFVDEKLMEKYIELFNKSFLITPNKEEYKKIMEFIKNNNLMIRNDLYILATGIDDILMKNFKPIKTFKGFRVDKEVHGTGCVYSTAITAFLSKGYDLEEAIKEAKRFVLSSVIYAKKSKFGYNSNPTYINKEKVIKNLSYAIYLLKKMNFTLIPEVGSNIAESLPFPKDFKDVAALTGRIIKNKLGGFYIVGDIEFGASEHIAKIILSASKFNPEIRACMNIKYDGGLIKLLKDKFAVSSFDRKEEPPNVSTMEWGTKIACEKFGGVPDIIYDRGGEGKEPMIRVLGRDAIEVVKKVEVIQKIYNTLM